MRMDFMTVMSLVPSAIPVGAQQSRQRSENVWLSASKAMRVELLKVFIVLRFRVKMYCICQRVVSVIGDKVEEIHCRNY